MSDAQTILQMIETVAPDDTAKLDEIDARVWCWINGYEFIGTPWFFEDKFTGWTMKFDNGDERLVRAGSSKQYTRSRDVLKAIRPEGFFPEIVLDEGGCAICKNKGIDSMCLPTEELAELHAVIQALEHERSQ